MSLATAAFLLFFMTAAVAALLLLSILPLLRALGLERQNFAGEPVLTGAGLAPALATAVVSPVALRLAGEAALGPFTPSGAGGLPLAAALAWATLAFAGLGLIDDLWGRRDVGGLRGHFRCFLHERRVTTGLIKAVGGVVVGCALGAAVARQEPAVSPGAGSLSWATAGRALLDGAWIALAANAINLLDLRPMRALKGAALLSGLVAALALALGPLARSAALVGLVLPAGALAPYLPLEARRRAMLGDAGANFLGAAVATIGAFALPPAAIVVLVALLLAFHLWTEGHSLSAAIAARPWLTRLDGWGWQRPGDEGAKR